MATGNDLLRGLVIINAQQASGIATKGAISERVLLNPAIGTLVGRRVYDTVTGQWVTVVGATVAYLPESMLAEVSGGK